MNFEPEMPGMNTHSSDGTKESQYRILVCASRPETLTVAALLEAADRMYRCTVTSDVKEFRTQLLVDRCEVILIAADDVDLELANDIRRLQPHASMVFAAPSVGVKDLTKAMQAGAVDFLAGPLNAEEVEERISLAATRSIELVDREERMHRLRSLSRRIDAESEPLEDIPTSVTNSDPDGPFAIESPASQDDDRRLDEVAMCSEFRTLIRQELDVEDLLRTALEYLLVKTGPTNAAVYLAGGDESFGLGAYVNCDLPRKSVEPMLRRLCDEACPAISEHADILRFEDANEFIAECDLGAEVSTDIEMVAVPCHFDGECLAVMFLFRSEAESFEDSVAQTLDALREILAEQLATLIRVHNRMENAWPEDVVDEEDDLGWDDLAA
jgi:DNA-binding NarL/FixJ family response regulator